MNSADPTTLATQLAVAGIDRETCRKSAAPDPLISVNDVFTRGQDRFRLLEFDGMRQRVYYIPMDTKNPLPQFWSMALFDHRDFRSSLKVLGPTTVDRPEIESAADAHVASLREARVSGLIKECGIELLDKATRNRHLKAYAARIGSTDRTLLADLRLWWLGGQTKKALFGTFFRCGERSSRQASRPRMSTVRRPLAALQNQVRTRPPSSEALAQATSDL